MKTNCVNSKIFEAFCKIYIYIYIYIFEAIKEKLQNHASNSTSVI